MDSHAMTEFRDHADDFVRRLKETGEPMALTVDGRPAAVVQDAEAYQHLLDLAASASEAEGIRQGLLDLAEGRTRPAKAVFDEIRADYGIPR